jgi:serine/threonine protein kinase
MLKLSVNKNRKIGEGSYGSVYECTDEKGKKYALKYILTGRDGIPNILEPTILSSIRYPYLINTSYIDSVPGKLFIVTELATSDLARKTRLNRGNQPLAIEKLKQWCFSLALAVNCLHTNKIIHCDIKATNCLLFHEQKGERVRLADFGLAIYDFGRKFNHVTCTSSHRAPEVFTKSGWSYPIDIWALGCTFYELAYGELLIPQQEPKKERNNKLIQCLIEFGLNHPLGAQTFFTSEELKTLDYTAIECCPVKYQSISKHERYTAFNDLIFHMLLPADKRYTIHQVLKHPFFKGLTDNSLCTLISSRVTIVDSLKYDKKVVMDEIHKYTNDTLLIDHILGLYSRTVNLTKIERQLKIAALVLIADKLVNPIQGLNISFEPNKLFEAEREICSFLNYRLHNMT